MNLNDYAKECERAVLDCVWLGVSVEDQANADLRIPALLDTPAAVRFLSCEPLLGPMDLQMAAPRPCTCGPGQTFLIGETRAHKTGCPALRWPFPDWVIVGGESGPGARPMHPEWVRSLRDQCRYGCAAFHFKQWGEWAPVFPVEAMSSDRVVSRAGLGLPWPERHDLTAEAMREAYAMRRIGRHAAGRELDGRTWDEYPAERDHQ